ncbi:hypothetical protein ACWGJX_41490 [Streptomyces sp. NPDC054775]|uniref:hypothetical protein n=1 Tax=Streptomyces sp. 3212.3 TaxID=1938846 RepID=UPI0015F249F1|nr:hypothetical protein [Streptomyces sp. 3212.3]
MLLVLPGDGEDLELVGVVGEERTSVYEGEHFIVSSFRSTPDVITEHHQAAPQ